MGAAVPRIDDLDSLLDDFDKPSTPINNIPYQQVSPPRMGQPWLGMAALAIALIAVASTFIPRGHSDDESSVKVDKPHVVIVEESSEHDKLPADQLAIFTSVPLRQFYDRNDVVYRNYDVDDEVDNESKMLQELREMITEQPPCVIVAKGSKATQFKLPKDPEAMEARVKKLIGGK